MGERTDDPFASVFDQGTAPPVASDRPDPFASLPGYVPPAPPPPGPDSRPWHVRALETADDAVRAAANAVTFGGADRLAGYMNSGAPQTLSGLITGQKPLTYDQAVNAEVARSDAARKRSPNASLGGELAGAVALPGFGGEMLAAKLTPKLGAALGRFGGYGAAGAGVGAAAGAGNTYSGEVPDYVKNALIGGGIGLGTGGVLGSALGPRPRISAAKTPITDEIYAARDFGYDALRNNKAVYENPYFAAQGDAAAANTAHFTPGDIPTTNRAIGQMRATADVPGGSITPNEIENIRKSINEIPFTPERAADRKAGREVKNAIDDFYASPPLGSVRPGTEADAAAAGEIADMSRKLHGGGRRAETFDNILHDANLAANRPGGSGRYSDYVWAGVRNLEKSDRPGAMPKLAGYSDAEKEALRKIAYPSWAQTALDKGGTMLGGGKGYGPINPFSLALGGAGAGYGASQYWGLDPKTTMMLGMAAPLTGAAMRYQSGRMANKAIQDASDVIHQSNPLYDYRVMISGTKSGGGLPASVNDATRNAVALELMKQTQPQRLPIDTSDWQ